MSNRRLPPLRVAGYQTRGLIKFWADAAVDETGVVSKFAATASPASALSRSAGPRPRVSVETRRSWITAWVTLGLLTVCFGSTLTIVVGLKPITDDLGTARQLVALAGALTWLGTGIGGIVLSPLAERLGIRRTLVFGAAMIALGLVISSSGGIAALLIGHALFVGVFGNGALYAPVLVYISRWFDRRRGTALALIWSGQYIAGIAWPTLFEHAITAYGWRATMAGFAVVVVIAVPIAARFLQRPPEPVDGEYELAGTGRRGGVLGLRPNTVLAILCTAGFACCVPMAIPQGHLVAFCSDLGIPAVQGAAMLSVMQAGALTSRMGWGWISDRIGSLWTVLAASSCQALAVVAFLVTQDEAGLFAVSAAYGLGFSGIIPGYIMAIREFYPSREAAWRVPCLLFVSMSGMAFGSWFAGALYDYFGFYAPAFASGALFNLLNLALVGSLVLRQRRGRPLAAMA